MTTWTHRGFTEWLMGETDANGNEQKDDDNNTDDDQAIGIKVEELPFERSFKRMELEIQITSQRYFWYIKSSTR